MKENITSNLSENFYRHINELDPAKFPRIALAIGIFDGVHPGHRKVMEVLQALAKKHNARAVVMTFSPHPREILYPDSNLLLLLPEQERIRRLCQAGADAVLMMPFDKHFAQLPPEEFIRMLTGVPGIRLSGITVGENWRFGCNGNGDTAFLQQAARNYGFDFIPVPELTYHREIVSSSSIRKAILSGNLELANALLGRPFALYGRVEHGYQIAGKVLEHPTANLVPEGKLLPPDGVYAAKVTLPEGDFPAAVNIGYAPTFAYKENRRRIEIHLLDFAGNLYDRYLSVELLQYLRQERSFPSPEDLSTQISKDIQTIRTLFRQQPKE